MSKTQVSPAHLDNLVEFCKTTCNRQLCYHLGRLEDRDGGGNESTERVVVADSWRNFGPSNLKWLGYSADFYLRSI